MNRACELAVAAALAALLVLAAAQTVPAARTGASAASGLCSTADRHQARWETGHAQMLRAWRATNWERAAVAAGGLARIARQALADARTYAATSSGARAFKVKVVRAHEGQRRAAALFVEAMVAAGAGRFQAGRSLQEANLALLRAGFVGDYC